MRTLYVSDLDGTLLRSDERTSPYTNAVINELVEQGMMFSYATARSYHTASKATAGLSAKIPVIVYNGAMIVDNADKTILAHNLFDANIHSVLSELMKNGIYPIVYSFLDGIERFSYIPEKCSRGMRFFLNTRRGDVRTRTVENPEELHHGEIFYLSCIDKPEKLVPFYEKYRDIYHCLYQTELYSGEHWLEIMPRAATKAHAIRQLKERLNCQRLVVFGDGKNDVDMFRLADEAYAPENAVEELKAIATGIIDSNDHDGVAKWLAAHVGEGESVL